jgi:hypothetical protein
MIRAAIVLAICLASTSALADRFNRQRAQDDVTWRLNQDQRRSLAVDALTSMLGFAAARLDESGRHDDADRLRSEWENHYRAVIGGVMPEDVGDHLPYSDWLALWYALLENEFGVDYMEWSHLRDIWVMNFALPVVFNPTAAEQWCVDQLRANPRDTCKAEYARHFVGTKYGPADPYATAPKHHGFSGVISWWSAWTACEIATQGTGFFLICSPAATVIEMSIELFVAPDVSDMIWNRYN